jgi:hypothetical protein
VNDDNDKSQICADLGYRASDLLQTNCIIWVEGPSDRIYLNHWLHAMKPELVEGLNYSIMFYGGKLRSHLTANDEEVEDFISLKRLNRYIVIIIDRDSSSQNIIKSTTVKRLRSEFNKGPGFAWITYGREIENYVDPAIIKKAVEKINKPAANLIKLDDENNWLKYTDSKGNERTLDKIKVAKEVVKEPANLKIHDLEKKIEKLVDFINKSNGI